MRKPGGTAGTAGARERRGTAELAAGRPARGGAAGALRWAQRQRAPVPVVAFPPQEFCSPQCGRRHLLKTYICSRRFPALQPVQASFAPGCSPESYTTGPGPSLIPPPAGLPFLTARTPTPLPGLCDCCLLVVLAPTPALHLGPSFTWVERRSSGLASVLSYPLVSLSS